MMLIYCRMLHIHAVRESPEHAPPNALVSHTLYPIIDRETGVSIAVLGENKPLLSA